MWRNFAELERSLEFHFKTRAGERLPGTDSWGRLFAMQHHGLPTRLLDWSRTFAVALYFALRNADGPAAVWILNPYRLNNAYLHRPILIDVDELAATYEECYIRRSGAKKFPGDVLAIAPPSNNPRIDTQRAGFTLHDDLATPLERLHPDVVEKILIPVSAQGDARDFLAAAGVSEFTLFPDLDGLFGSYGWAFARRNLST